jgi:2-C-methyl-D-erythritol 4-phosphate cytidylyltransferase
VPEAELQVGVGPATPEAGPHIGVVLVAAGAGTRLGSNGPKALVRLAGAPLVVHALRALAAAGLPPPVVVHPRDARDAFVAATDGLAVAAFVPGGATRTDSVRAGVAALSADVAVVAVHDAARPLMPAGVIATTVAAVASPRPGDPAPSDAAQATPRRDAATRPVQAPPRQDAATRPVLAAAPALPVVDTLKRVVGSEVVATVRREQLVAVQTPQVFPAPVLALALRTADEATDDLALVERLVTAGRLDGRIVVVPGSAWGTKVTLPSDLELVAALAAGGTAPLDEAAP